MTGVDSDRDHNHPGAAYIMYTGIIFVYERKRHVGGMENKKWQTKEPTFRFVSFVYFGSPEEERNRGA